MFKNHVYGIDLGSNMIKIYSQNSNEILKEKNMIAIRNKDTVLAVGDEAYEIYEKNPTNVKVSSPMLNGMIANISHLEIMLQLLLYKSGRSVGRHPVIYFAVPSFFISNGTTFPFLKYFYHSSYIMYLHKIIYVKHNYVNLFFTFFYFFL